ncbi:TonB-dependent receptor plug domain-containing protein [Sphingomonas nostoxanthinifaciens]|uniref:TonB-dependent receptor plug domain-containing protein n=1 Tax=Sphingomonas nostoxanthinifaciens TaxID=2872652 RepID=UPI001CC1E6DE|nr:TonB-dependent receptor [Sphingomonas nostoxanthinifaciens]UAK26250.1 TonB-dependent receptor [Sphingomonas nostoxanthinifaciens]
MLLPLSTLAHAQTGGPDPAAADGSPKLSQDEIIVTGTRASKRAVDSNSPIQVLSADALKASSQTNLTDALTTLNPSVSRRNNGTDVGALTNSIRLRGLNPNHVLVLVDGVRRHNTANIYAPAGPDQGSTPVDLDMIPTNLIDHIEILQDGAAAQYGSDAIAGVVNIILKHEAYGFGAHGLTGVYGHGDGWSSNVGTDYGMALGSDGFVHIAAEFTHNDHTDRGLDDSRTGKHDNKVFGDPKVTRENVGLNFMKPITDGIELYGNATYAHRYADAYENYRLPTVAPSVFPNGFSPREITHEDDYAGTLGLRGDNLLGFKWDLSSTYGRDQLRVSMRDTVNLDLLTATGSTPTALDLQHFRFSQWTNDLGLSRDVDIGLASPLHVALGGEFRKDYYKIGAGDPDSYYGSGTQALVGIAPVSTGNFSRNVYAGWGDIEAHLTSKWDVDLAGRYEDYSDAGDTWTGKISTRYQIIPQAAIRGTFSNGFRAPTLAEEHFTNLFVSPTGASGQLAVSSVAAKLLGATPLKPEKSTSISAGLVLEPIDRLTVTVDAYQIYIKKRIIGGGDYNGQTAINALTAQGISLPSGLDPNNVSATYFANGADTRTRGIDVTANYRTDLGNAGVIDWSVAATFNKTSLRKLNNDANGKPLLNAQGISYLVDATPRNKVILGAHWTHGLLDLNLRETEWGKASQELSYTVGPNAYSNTLFIPYTANSRWLTDIELGYKIFKGVRLAVGSNNLFGAHPNRIPVEARYLGVLQYSNIIQQVGANGGFYYGKIDLSF